MRKALILILLFVSVVAYGQRNPAAFHGSSHLGENPELINNGTFDDGSNWEMAAGWTITGGEAVYDDVDDYETIYQVDANMAGSMEASTTYTLKFDVTSGGGTGVRFKVTTYPAGVGNLIDAAYYTTDSYEVDVTTESSNYTGIRFYAYTDGDGGSIDNISLKKK